MLNAIFFFFFSILFILGVVLLFWVSDRLPVMTKKGNAMKDKPGSPESIILQPDKLKNMPSGSETFETDTPGIFVAGELGGALSIKEAAEQAVGVVNYISGSLKDTNSADYDLIIVGAGQAGLSAALKAKMHDLKFMVLEQYSIEQAISDHPREKVTGTIILDLPLAGALSLKNYSRKQLMEMWQSLILKFRIPIQENCRVLFITAPKGYFKVLAQDNQNFTTKFVLLTTGKRKVSQWIPVIKTLHTPENAEAGKRSIYAGELIY